jgi:hypothetical protein
MATALGHLGAEVSVILDRNLRQFCQGAIVRRVRAPAA